MRSFPKRLQHESMGNSHLFVFQPGDGSRYPLYFEEGLPAFGIDQSGNGCYSVLKASRFGSGYDYIMEKTGVCKHTAVLMRWFYLRYLQFFDSSHAASPKDPFEFTKKDVRELSEELEKVGCLPLECTKDLDQ